MASALFIKNIPAHLLQDQIIFHAWLNLSPKCALMAVVTEDHILFEVRNKEILTSCSLKSPDKEPEQNGSSIINGKIPSHNPDFSVIIELLSETWADLMDINEGPSVAVKFRVMYSYDLAGIRHIHYLVLINENLLVVERANLEERSEMVLKHYYEHVIEYQIVDKESTGRPTIIIHKLDGSQVSVNLIKSVKDTTTVHNYEELSNRTTLLTYQLQTQKAFHQKILQDIGDQSKFEPSNDGNPKSECLVRYGDPWKRIYNDQLIIGIPILNASSR